MMPFLNLRSALVDELAFNCVSTSVHGTDSSMSNYLMEFLSCLAENFDAPSGLLEILKEARKEIRSNDSLNIIPILNRATKLSAYFVSPDCAGIEFSSRLERDCSNLLGVFRMNSKQLTMGLWGRIRWYFNTKKGQVVGCF